LVIVSGEDIIEYDVLKWVVAGWGVSELVDRVLARVVTVVDAGGEWGC